MILFLISTIPKKKGLKSLEVIFGGFVCFNGDLQSKQVQSKIPVFAIVCSRVFPSNSKLGQHQLLLEVPDEEASWSVGAEAILIVDYEYYKGSINKTDTL